MIKYSSITFAYINIRQIKLLKKMNINFNDIKELIIYYDRDSGGCIDGFKDDLFFKIIFSFFSNFNNLQHFKLVCFCSKIKKKCPKN